MEALESVTLIIVSQNDRCKWKSDAGLFLLTLRDMSLRKSGVVADKLSVFGLCVSVSVLRRLAQYFSFARIRVASQMPSGPRVVCRTFRPTRVGHLLS